VDTAKLEDGAVTTAKIANGAVTADKLAHELPRGVLGYAFRTSNITGLSGGPVDLPDLSVQVTVPAGRLLRVVGYVRAWTAPAQGNQAYFIIREGNNTLSFRLVIAVTTNRAEGGAVEALIRPSAGTHTYKLSFEQVTGTGNWAVHATSTVPAHILVEDIGADPNG